MGLLDVVKILFLPALIAGTLYLLGAYVLLPLYRRHHARYSQYIPLDTISSSTQTARHKFWNGLTRLILPRSMRWRDDVVDGRRGSLGEADEEDQWVVGEEEGENMVGFGRDVERLERDRDERGGRVRVVGGERRERMVDVDEIDSQRRLSRELEEGFKDESESEGESERGVRR